MAWYRCVGGAGGSLKLRTASGAIAIFSTNMVEPFKSLKTDITPVQDLHGYSKPWSGGGGKNKLNYEAWKTTGITRGTAVWENNGVTLTATGNDCYTLTSTDAKVPMSEGETITLSWEETTNKLGQTFIFPNGTTTGMVTVNNGAVKKATYTATSGITFVTFRFGVANSGDTIAYKNIQIEKGSQATSWEPYSNICPISGFNALSVTRTGKNRLNYDAWKTMGIARGTAVWENNGVTLTATGNDCFTVANERIPVTEGELITLSWEEGTNQEGTIFIFPNGSTSGMVRVSNRTQKYISYTVTSGVTFVTFRFGVANSGDTIAYKNIQIEKGSTTDFEPYNGQSATVNFGQTVYKGVADVTGGNVVSKMQFLDIANANIIKNNSNPNDYMYYTTLGTTFDKNGHGICSHLQETAGAPTGSTEGFSISQQFNVVYINVGVLAQNDVAGFKAFCANNNVQLLLDMLTPIEITTTPENLTAISGENNVYADTNGDMEVKYLYRG